MTTNYVEETDRAPLLCSLSSSECNSHVRNLYFDTNEPLRTNDCRLLRLLIHVKLKLRQTVGFYFPIHGLRPNPAVAGKLFSFFSHLISSKRYPAVSL